MDKILEMMLTTVGIPVFIFILGWVAARYIKPWVNKSDERFKRAQEIAMIANRITEALVIQFPNATWDDWLDAAVKKIIEETGLNENIAKREAIHQLLKTQGNEGVKKMLKKNLDKKS